MQSLVAELVGALDSQLTPGEERLVNETLEGRALDFSDEDIEPNDPEKARAWEKARSVRARCIEWLVSTQEVRNRIPAHGIRIKGAKVLGNLNLENSSVPFPIELVACELHGTIGLQQAHLRALNLRGSHLCGLDAVGLECDGSINLDEGFRSKGKVSLHGASIAGTLDCSKAEFLNPDGEAICALNMQVKGDVFLRNDFKAIGRVSLAGAEIRGELDCSTGEFSNATGDAIYAKSIEVGESVLLCDGFRAAGLVDLRGARIGGELDCSNGQFSNPTDDAIDGTIMNVKGGVFLCRGFKAEGRVALYGASAGITLDCSASEFLNPNGDAIYAENVHTRGDVFLRNGFTATGRVSLAGAEIGGDLDCSEGAFSNSADDAIYAPDVGVRSSIRLCGSFTAVGRVSLSGATARVLDCTGGHFSNPSGEALMLQGFTADRDVLLRNGLRAEGAVTLYGASIRGTLDCSASEFLNPNGDAIYAENVHIKGDIFLRDGFKAKGQVSLFAATVGGTLNCSAGEFSNPGGNALLAPRMKTGISVDLRNGFKAEGAVVLYGATIGGELDCSKGEFLNADGDALDLEGVRIADDVYLMAGFRAVGRVCLARSTIGGAMKWTGTVDPGKATVDLRNASVGVLSDAADSWPSSGNLYLHGLCYEEIDTVAPQEAATRIRWLRLQPESAFHVQPYVQLARVLRGGGNERAAKLIHIAKSDDRLRLGDVSPIAKPAHWLLKLTTGYGYKPWRPMAIALLLVAIGWGLFFVGSREGIMSRVDNLRFVSADGQQGDLVHPAFHPLLYSLDTFLPVISFNHAGNWAPNEEATGHLLWSVPLSGLALRGYQWFMNLGGWILTTLFIITLTGTIRRRLN